jgi:hypothetical protein
VKGNNWKKLGRLSDDYSLIAIPGCGLISAKEIGWEEVNRVIGLIGGSGILVEAADLHATVNGSLVIGSLDAVTLPGTQSFPNPAAIGSICRIDFVSIIIV